MTSGCHIFRNLAKTLTRLMAYCKVRKKFIRDVSNLFYFFKAIHCWFGSYGSQASSFSGTAYQNSYTSCNVYTDLCDLEVDTFE